MLTHRAISGDRMPLARHFAFRSFDLAESIDQVARRLKPARFELRQPDDPVDVVQNFVRLRHVAFSYLRVGAAVRIDPHALEQFYLVQIPVSGNCAVEHDGARLLASPRLGTVISPDRPFAMDWSADCALIEVKIDRTALQNFAASHSGVAADRPLDFDLALPLDSGFGASVKALIDMFCGELDRPDSLLSIGRNVAAAEEMLLLSLIEGQGYRYRDGGERAPLPAPAYVRLAEDIIRTRPEADIAVADLAAASGVSVRSLQAGFRAFRRTTPSAYLRAVRLERARADLAAASKDARNESGVTEIALKWGFSHLGRFAADYARRFGELPSRTLKRRR